MDNLFSVAERFGTPCFVFDEVQLARRMKAVRDIVPEDIRHCYSNKENTNLNPALRRLVAEYLYAFYQHKENRGLDIFADCNAIQ